MTSSEIPSVGRAAVESLVMRFEDGTIELDEFHHRQHLTVAAWLLLHEPSDSALARMRRGLSELLRRSGKATGYHETVTVFWMRALALRLAACPRDWSPEARLSNVVEWALETRPLDAHYSPERLAEPEARERFLEPDRLPLPVPSGNDLRRPDQVKPASSGSTEG